MRTVGVRLKAQISEYVREMRTSKAETKSFKDELVEAGKRGEASATALGRGMGVARRAIDDVGDAADRAGDDLDELRRDAERLEGQIDETANAVRRLAREIVTTSDAATRRSLVGDLAKQRAALRELTDLRKLIDVDTGKGIGEELASQVSVSFVQRLGPLIARAPMAGMNPAALAIGAPLAAGVATLIGTAAGGAIIGGTAGLGIVGGLKIAARHPAVKREAGELKEEIASVFEDAAVAFVPETLDAIDTIRVRLRDLEPELRQVFTATSRYVDPLLDGIADGVEEMMPGVIRAVESAGPVVDALAEGFRRIGDAVGDGLAQLAPHADEAARALNVLLAMLEWGTRGAFALVDGMSRLYKVAELVGALINGDVKGFWALATAQNDATSASLDLSEVLPPLEEDIGGVGGKAGDAAVKVETLNEALRRLVDDNVAAEEASIRLEEAIDRATEAAKRNGDGIDANKPKQRDNRQALVDLAKATTELYDRTLEQTGSHELAAQAAARGRTKFLETAEAMGVERDEAVKLADKLIAIPNVTRTVTVNANTKPALDDARSIVRRINEMSARINVRAEPSGGFGGGAHTGFGYSTGNRWGGVYEHAAVGKLREAQIASPMGPARYGWAEPATGGELFAPKHGDLNRTKALVGYAVENWWGGWQNFAPSSAPAGGVQVNEGDVHVTVEIDGQELDSRVVSVVRERDRDLKRRAMAGPEL